ncbi:MAG: DUF3575 domain-containing protein [Muribaculaceae bacterium]|nr:DUF3575 domain-containing protein [Muribaculaceae bacterium]
MIGMALLGIGAKAEAAEIVDSVEVYFHQGRARIEPEFHSNGLRIDSLNEFVTRDSRLRLKGVKVIGSASPEGSVAINKNLSERRAKSIFNAIAALPDSIAEFDYIGRDWAGLRQMVEQDPQVPSRRQTLSLLNKICSQMADGEPDNAENLRRVKELPSYNYMYQRMFPALRFSRLFVNYEPALRGSVTAPGLLPVTYTVVSDTPELALLPIAPARKPFYMALKTNMLFDAALIPNLGAEFYVGRNWSVTANWAYAWWDKNSTHRYWRYYGGDIGVRRWFGRAAERKPLTGHHLGLSAGVFTFDFEMGGRGYMGGKPGRTLWDRCLMTSALEYGYSLPVSRRLNIDFSIGVGYAGGKIVEYTPREGKYIWEKTKRVNWFGPTKAEISLVWLIGRGNVNSRKGASL